MDPTKRLMKHYIGFERFLNETKGMFDKKWGNKVEPNATFDDFNKYQTLGTGSFGRVMLVTHKVTNVSYAMKILDKNQIVKKKQVKHTLSEICILNALEFQFVICLDYYFKDNVYLYLCLPLVNGGEMFTHLRNCRKFSEELSQFYAAQVIMAFEYLHFLGLIYRDLKPENILLDKDGYIKVADMGFCKKIDTARTYTLCGTPEYLAPEIILSKPYSYSVDWWALGVLIYEMAAGNPPFYSNDPMKTYEKIVQGKFACPPHFSIPLKDLVGNIIQVDLTKRYGNLKNGVKDIKGHEWFKKLDWDAVLERKIKPSFVPKTGAADDVSNFDPYEEEDLKTSPIELYPKEFAEIFVE